MDWQQVIALGIVAVTAIWMTWRVVRPRRHLGQGSSCPGCGAAGSGPRERVVFHRRKGEPLEIHIRPPETGRSHATPRIGS